MRLVYMSIVQSTANPYPNEYCLPKASLTVLEAIAPKVPMQMDSAKERMPAHRPLPLKADKGIRYILYQTNSFADTSKTRCCFRRCTS